MEHALRKDLRRAAPHRHRHRLRLAIRPVRFRDVLGLLAATICVRRQHVRWCDDRPLLYSPIVARIPTGWAAGRDIGGGRCGARG